MVKRKSLAEQLREVEARVDGMEDAPRDDIPDHKEQRLGPTKRIKEQFEDAVPAKLTKFIELEKIEVLPGLDRDPSEFTGDAFEELKASIKASGMNDIPIEVRYTPGKPEDTAYQLVAGHRRLRALRDLGFPTVYATVRSLSDAEMDRLHEIENAKRAGKVPWSLAKQLSAMFASGRYETQAELAKALDRDEGNVSLYLKVIKDAPPGLWEKVENPHEMSFRDAQTLVKAFAKPEFKAWAGKQTRAMAFKTLMGAASKSLARPKPNKPVADKIREAKRGDSYIIIFPAEVPEAVRQEVLRFAKERAGQ